VVDTAAESCEFVPAFSVKLGGEISVSNFIKLSLHVFDGAEHACGYDDRKDKADNDRDDCEYHGKSLDVCGLCGNIVIGYESGYHISGFINLTVCEEVGLSGILDKV
jgi:hypothetical protein